MLTTVAVIAACTVGAADNVQIIEFTGQGCGACRHVATVVERLKQAGCEIHQVDVNQRQDLAEAFGIRGIPCFVVVRDQRVVDRLVGAASYEELSAFCQRAVANSVVRGQAHAPNRRGTMIDHLRERAAFANRQSGGEAPSVRQQTPDVATSPGLVGSATIVTNPNSPPSPVYPDFSTEAPPLDQAAPQPVTMSARHSTPVAAVIPAAVAVAPRSEGTKAVNPVEQALQATVRVRIEDEQGHSFGTGTVIDVHDHEALILTCGHIFRASGGRGRITCDFFAAGGSTAEGTLICYDIRRDVGLISARPNTEVVPIRVGGNGRQPKPGDTVFSVGCNHGEAPSIIQNKILAVNRYHGPANLVVGGRPVDGRSGGGLFASDGTLIGVCNAADEQQDEGLYAALGPIHAELDRAGLAFVYRPRGPSMVSPTAAGGMGVAPSQFLSDGSNTIANASSATTMPTRMPSYGQPNDGRHGQPPSDATLSSTPASNDPVVSPAVSSGSMTGPLRDSEELICIIRSNQNGMDRSRVVVIDRPSADLVSRLSQEVNQRGPHAATNMHVPTRPPVPSAADPRAASKWEGDWHGQ